MSTDRRRTVDSHTILGAAGFLALLGLYALLTWARRARVHDATTLVPASLNCVRRPSDGWPDDAIDRLGEALEGEAGDNPDDPDEHEGGFI